MQSERTVEEAALSGGARGLGVCDVLRLELVPAQLPGLVEQVEALEEEIRRRPAARSAHPRSNCVQYERHLVELLRARLPAGEVSEPFALIGPAGMMSRVARGAMRRAAEVLAVAELVLRIQVAVGRRQFQLGLVGIEQKVRVAVAQLGAGVGIESN